MSSLNEVRCPRCRRLICKSPNSLQYDPYPYTDQVVAWLHEGRVLIEIVCTRCKEKFIVSFLSTEGRGRTL
jgi:phage FluMu protein Com